MEPMDLATAPTSDLPSYLWPRPKYRGFLHAAGAVAIVPLGVLLVAAATSTTARVAAGIYAGAQLCVFATSALYHLVAQTPTARRRMQMADHLMIYVLIAGTWVPVCLLVLPDDWGPKFLVGVGVIALTGIVLKAVGIHRFPRSSNAMYIVMGWVGVLAVPAIVDNIEFLALCLLAAGGIVYTVGATILMLKRPDPRPTIFGYHEVWHACTVVAAACHFGMVWMIAT